MPNPSHNQRLNRILIRVYRSLLQYVAECWPWADAQISSEQRTVEQMMREQQIHVGRLVELLSVRGWPIDFGSYPTEFTDLHYIGLEYLLNEIIADETALVAELDRARSEAADDPAAAALLAELAVSERGRLTKLRELAAALPAPSVLNSR